MNNKASSSFYNEIQSATNEDKQVNPIYVNAIKSGLKKLGGGLDDKSANYDKYTDGVFNCYFVSDSDYKEWFLLQLECKLDVDLKDHQQLAKVILQVCFYLKQFERAGMQLPKVVVVGTKRNCFAIPTIILYTKYVKNVGYATEDSTGKRISASTAPNHPLYAPRLNAIANDIGLQSHIRITETSDKNAINELCIDILKAAKELGLKEDINVENLARVYDFFEMRVIDQKQKERLTTRELVGAFMQLMINPGNVTAEQTRNALGQITYSGAMNFNGKVIQVDSSAFNSFANVFAIKTYDIKDQKAITEIVDRLIEDTDRRRKGDFYTPTIWVSEAHKLMDKHLGADWREKYMVWDCAWGTGNLTRDYAFDDLYCSTLIQEDLDTASRYNPFACKFQYDFLNDDVNEFESIPRILYQPFFGIYTYDEVKQYMNFEDILDFYAWAITKNKITEEQAQQAYSEAISILHSTKLFELAPGLINSLLGAEGKPRKSLVFLINPPYGTSGELTPANGKEKKSGIAYSVVNSMMRDDKVGGCSQQLYAQFIYRISKLNDIFKCKAILGIFSPTLLMVGEQFKGLKKYFGKLIDGYMIQASEFADVKNNWAISFTVWGISEDEASSEYRLTIRTADNPSNTDSVKVMYRAKEKASNWVKKIKPTGGNIETFTMSSAIKITNGTCKISEKSLGVALMNQNIVESNTQFVMILPRKLKGHLSSYDITDETFDRIISYFTARKLIVPTWINCKDEYMVPNTEHPEYVQWQNDCIVYSLFNTASNQSSLRSIEYNNKLWDIYNEFFWLSRSKMLQLAEQYNNMAVYDDVMSHSKTERFVYERLKTVTLSEDAQAVLDAATALLIKTFPFRAEFAEKHPEYHINTWDAGWYQIKAIAKEYCKEDLVKFNELYTQFSDRLRPLVYELGFLYK